MAKARSHYPPMIYILVLVCALGLTSVALGIVDGWVLIAAGATAICLALARLHVILNRRRAGLDRALLPRDHNGWDEPHPGNRSR